MKRIWKYKIPLNREIKLFIPKGGEIISVKFRYENDECFFNIWVIIDPDKEEEVRSFRVIVTGQISDFDGLKHLCTGVDNQGFVFHLFEEMNETERIMRKVFL